MKKNIPVLITLASLAFPVVGYAQDHSVSVGYAQGKVSDGDTLKGANIKYRYEWDSPVSVIGSMTYMSGDKNIRETKVIAPDIISGKRKTDYFSISAGPAYRFNDKVSVYGTVGWAQTKVKGDNMKWLNHMGGGVYEDMGSIGGAKKTRNTASYGVGVQINPVKNLVIDVAYEGAGSSNGFNNKSMNAFSLGVGYKF